MDYTTSADQIALGNQLVKEYKIQSLTNCSTVPPMTTRNGQFDFASREPSSTAAAASRTGEVWMNWQRLRVFRNSSTVNSLQQADQWVDPVGRRRLPALMGASLALAGLTGCTKQPDEPIVPYVKAPEEIIPGKPLFFASAMPVGGIAEGPAWIESHMGGPTKVEGIRSIRASLGATSVLAQASILQLYDPDRSQTVTQVSARFAPGAPFSAGCAKRCNASKPTRAPVCACSPKRVTSPTLHGQLQRLLAEFPAAKWHQYEPANRDSVRQGAQLASFGTTVATRTTWRRRTSSCRSMPISSPLARGQAALYTGFHWHAAKSAAASTR